MNVKKKLVLVFRLITTYAILLGLFSLTLETDSVMAAGQDIPAPIRINGFSFDPITNAPRFANEESTTDYQIIQFNRPIRSEDKEAIEAMGVELLGYIPHLAYLARMNGADTQTIQNHPLIRWVGAYASAYKISPSISNARTTDASASMSMSVSLFAGSDIEAFTRFLADKDIETLSFYEDSIGAEVVISVSLRELDEIAQFDGVSWVEEFSLPEFMNANATVITGITGMRSNKGFDGYYGAGQIIAIADSGLHDHEDFYDKDGNSRVLWVYDVEGDGDTSDPGGHGTHVAGTALGNGFMDGSDLVNQNYDSFHAGVAPEAKIVFQATHGPGLPNIPTLFEQAHTNPTGEAFIHSNSWGFASIMGRYSTTAVRVDQYVWDHPEFLPVIAAGNSGGFTGNPGSVTSPGTAKNALTVGATHNYGTDNPIDELWGRSGRGPVLDGRVKPDIVAPGTGIHSTSIRDDMDYIRMSGTSMATPHVAGAAALVREYLGRDNHTMPSAALIKAILVNGAIDLSVTNPDLTVSRPNMDMGWGQLNVKKSVSIDSSSSLLYWDSLSTDSRYVAPMETGDVKTIIIRDVSPTTPLRITLAWSDYIGSSAANGGLVNDLDLMVTAPNGTIYYPNNADNGGLGGNFDHINNLVGIDIADPQAGDYTITIMGYNVPQDSQPYALAVNGTLGPDPTSSDPIHYSTLAGPGIYVIGDSSVRLDVESETTGRIYAEKINTASPSRVAEYQLTTEDLAGEPLIAKISAGYAQAEFDMSGIVDETSLTLCESASENLSLHESVENDVVNNMVTTTDAIPISPLSNWWFHNQCVVTAVTLSATHIDSGMRTYAPLLIPLGLIMLTIKLVVRRRRNS